MPAGEVVGGFFEGFSKQRAAQNEQRQRQYQNQMVSARAWAEMAADDKFDPAIRAHAKEESYKMLTGAEKLLKPPPSKLIPALAGLFGIGKKKGDPAAGGEEVAPGAAPPGAGGAPPSQAMEPGDETTGGLPQPAAQQAPAPAAQTQVQTPPAQRRTLEGLRANGRSIWTPDSPDEIAARETGIAVDRAKKMGLVQDEIAGRADQRKTKQAETERLRIRASIPGWKTTYGLTDADATAIVMHSEAETPYDFMKVKERKGAQRLDKLTGKRHVDYFNDRTGEKIRDEDVTAAEETPQDREIKDWRLMNPGKSWEEGEHAMATTRAGEDKLKRDMAQQNYVNAKQRGEILTLTQQARADKAAGRVITVETANALLDNARAEAFLDLRSTKNPTAEQIETAMNMHLIGSNHNAQELRGIMAGQPKKSPQDEVNEFKKGSGKGNWPAYQSTP